MSPRDLKFRIDFSNAPKAATKLYWDATRARKRKNTFPVPKHVQRLFDWNEKASDNSKEQTFGKRFKDLIYTDLDIDQNEWHFERALGRGGFGVVGLFSNRSSSGRIIDEVAVKTCDRQISLEVKGVPGLSSEAAVMANLNEHAHLDTVASLRAYKAYLDDGQWKFYMSHESHGDLERLRCRYKAFGQYLPELFLWQIFLSLLSPITKFANADGNQKWRLIHDPDYWTFQAPQIFLLHCDLKPPNVLVGDRRPGGQAYENEVQTKTSDYGLARMLFPGDVEGNSTAKSNRRGTSLWMAPEIQFDKLKDDGSFYPFGSKNLVGSSNDPERFGNHEMTSKSNLWGIGAIMYQMLTLEDSPPSTLLAGYLRQDKGLTLNEDTDLVTPENIQHCLKNGQIYSRSLIRLICKCMRIDPRKRPTEEEVYLEVKGKFKQLNSAKRDPNRTTAGVAGSTGKVFYARNDINSAPFADHVDFDLQSGFWSWYWRDQMFVPDEWGPLRPTFMPTNTLPPGDWPESFRKAWMKLNPPNARRSRSSSRRASVSAGVKPRFQSSPSQHKPISATRSKCTGSKGTRSQDLSGTTAGDKTRQSSRKNAFQSPDMDSLVRIFKNLNHSDKEDANFFTARPGTRALPSRAQNTEATQPSRQGSQTPTQPKGKGLRFERTPATGGLLSGFFGRPGNGPWTPAGPARLVVPAKEDNRSREAAQPSRRSSRTHICNDTACQPSRRPLEPSTARTKRASQRNTTKREPLESTPKNDQPSRARISRQPSRRQSQAPNIPMSRTDSRRRSNGRNAGLAIMHGALRTHDTSRTVTQIPYGDDGTYNEKQWQGSRSGCRKASLGGRGEVGGKPSMAERLAGHVLRNW